MVTRDACLPFCADDWEHRTVRCHIRESDRTECEACRQNRSECGRVRRRRYAPRTPWRKCVTVTAAFCIVFIVGALCPGGWAAPAERARGARRGMERAKRSDEPIWRNPCNIELDVDKRGGTRTEMDTKAAGKVQNMARNILAGARDYQDILAKNKQSQDFNAAVARSAHLRSKLVHPWYELPEKTVGEELDWSGRHKEYFERYLNDLPAMYKYLELLLGAVEKIPSGSDFSNAENSELEDNLGNTLSKMRGLLCEFDALLMNRGIKKLQSLEPSEVPERSDNDTQGELEDFLVFRDTLNFLEIMYSFFGEMFATGK